MNSKLWMEYLYWTNELLVITPSWVHNVVLYITLMLPQTHLHVTQFYKWVPRVGWINEVLAATCASEDLKNGPT